MIPLKLKRRYLRAPLNNECLIKVGKELLKGEVSNISEGGLLLKEFQVLPHDKQFSVFMEIPALPDFTKISTNELLDLGRGSFEFDIVGTIVEVKRSKLNESSNTYEFGCEFADIRREAQEKINEYVRNFGVNIVFSLTLFEQGTHRSEVKVLIKKCVELLNYSNGMSMAKIREQLLHDYQSLESL